MNDDAASDTPFCSLQDDMHRMLRDAAFSDIVFVCGDAQEEVHAAKLLVAARSPVLESMLLRGGMAETTLARIPLPGIKAGTMRLCLEFFYTDIVQHSSWSGFESSMDVVYASRFFLVGKLGHLAISHMRSAISAGDVRDINPEDVGNDLADVTKAYSYGVMLHHAHPDMLLHDLLIKFVHRIGMEKMWTMEWHKHLSENALIHFLQHVDTQCGHQESPINEYFHFRHVVQWCFSQEVLASDDPSKLQRLVEDAMNRFLPLCIMDARHALCDECMDANMAKLMMCLAQQLSSCLQKVPVNFSRIPSSILCKVIEPLNIIPNSMLMSAYRLQALRRADLRWDEFGHGDNYEIMQDNFAVITCKSDDFEGFARCSMFVETCMSSSHWEFVILTPCEQLRVGFYAGGAFISLSDYDEYLLGDYADSWALDSSGRFHSSLEDERHCSTFNINEGTKIGVHVDNGWCSFSLNGNRLGVRRCWAITKGKRVYPAISMQKPGRAQVQLINQDSRLND